MMGRRLPLRSGDEQDVCTKWRRRMKWCGHAGACARVKRWLRRRERRAAKDEVQT